MNVPSGSQILNALRRATEAPLPNYVPDTPPILTSSLTPQYTPSSSSSEEQDQHEPEQKSTNKRKRKLQQVSTIRSPRIVVRWMVAEVEDVGTSKCIASKAVPRFPECFRGSEKANLNKAFRWFKSRESILDTGDDEIVSVNHHVVRRRVSDGQSSIARKEMLVKASKGRGRKRKVWTVELQRLLVAEFQRLSKTGLKFNGGILRTLAKRILTDEADEYEWRLELGMSERYALVCKVTKRWVQTFMDRFHIVRRKQCGKLMISPVKQEKLEKEVAYHLGAVKRAFEAGELDEDLVENVDETHFVVKMDNGRTLSFIGCSGKYADVSSGGEGMTMMVRITGGGGRNASIQPSFTVFQNKSRNYPIRGVPDDIPGVSYRTGPKGWMDQRVFLEWLSEPRAIKKDTYGRRRVMFLDNCSGHLENADQHQKRDRINASIKFLPKNSTHLCQPADSFVIQKIKQRWRTLWDEGKVRLMSSREWLEGSLESGKLPNPGKRFFLKLAAQVIRDVNAMRDANGLSYSQKAMIRCGLSRDLNGQWRVSQLFPHLQNIISKHQQYFDRQNPLEEEVVGGQEVNADGSQRN